MVLIMAFFSSHSPKVISFSLQSVNIRALAKVLFLTTGIFQREALTNFSIFLNRNVLFLDCSKKDLTYISDILTLFEYILRIKIKNKCEIEDDHDRFLNGPNFMRSRIIIPMLLIKANFFYKLLSRKYIFRLTKCEDKGVSERINSEDRNVSSLGLAA